ncbi:MAG TPA: hypothetical protein GXZ51_04740 [Acholeplasma sp.]|jgi:hypothetical protein|nr:hypothetical protein [Acholeplasma sp.]
MECKKERSLFNLFEVFDCKKCQEYPLDLHFMVGNTLVAVYNLFKFCPIDEDFVTCNNERIKQIFIEMVLNQENSIYLFIEDFKIEKYFDELELLLDLGEKIIIISF